MNNIRQLNRESAELTMPQAVNCIDFFRKLFIKDLPDELHSNVWVAGGGVKDYFVSGKIENDIDFFSSDRKFMAKLVVHFRNKYQFKHFLITKNAIKGYLFVKGKKINVDIVKKEFQNPVDTLSKFDFTICCFSVCNDTFFWNESAPFDLLRKRLVINELPHPVDTMKRLQKYTKKGYFACNGTILTIAKGINKIDNSESGIFDFYKFD